MRHLLHIAIPVVVPGLLASVAPARAQSGERSCGEGTGVVSGVVVDASTRAPISGAMVRLWRDPASRPRCVVSTGAEGSFVIVGRPGGLDSLVASAMNFRRLRPLAVRVREGDTTEVVITLVPGTLLDECRDAALCRDWLMAPRRPGLTDDDGFRIVALHTAAVLAWQSFDTPFDAYICLPENTPARVFDAIRARHPRTAPSRECELVTSPAGPRPRTRLRHVPTGEPAYRLAVEIRRSISPTERVVELSYYVGRLWAAGWHCTFVRSDGAWGARACTLRWES